MTKLREPSPPLRSPLTLRSGLFALGLLLAWSAAQAFQAGESGTVIPATGTIDVLFTPGQDAAGEVVQAIRQARKQILVQAFSFTHKDIAAALIAAHKRGIDVQLLADAVQSRRMQRDKVKQMAAAGLPVWTDAEHQSAHNKIMVIDVDTPDAIVITGSYNFTFAAQFNNAENLLLFRGNQPLARLYRDNWQRHLRHAQRWSDH